MDADREATEADIRLAQDDGAEFAFEMKWDGYRILADVGRDVRLVSRGGKDYTRLFPHASELMQMLADGGCVDGELVALGPDGRPVGTMPLPQGADQDDEGGPGGLADMVEQPAKVMRIGNMIRQLLEEVKWHRCHL